MVKSMPDKYRRYRNGGGVMGLSERVKKQVKRDSGRGGPDLNSLSDPLLRAKKKLVRADPKTTLRAKRKRMLATGLGGIKGLQNGGDVGPRHEWPQYDTPDRGMPYMGTTEMPFLSALKKEIGREGRFSLPKFLNARTERRARQQASGPMSLEDYRGEDWATREDDPRWYTDIVHDSVTTAAREDTQKGMEQRPLDREIPLGTLQGPERFESYEPPDFRRALARTRERPVVGGDFGQWWDIGKTPKRHERFESYESPNFWMGLPGFDTSGRASGGIVGLQKGGVIRGYQQGGIPANYAAPQAYAGYGMPGQFAQRQEHLSPEVAQQYAALTQGIMRAGGRGYEDVRYKGPQLAGFTGMEAAAQAGAGAYGRGAGPQGTLQAASTLSQAAQGIGGVIPEQEALARQYGTMARGARTLGTDAATEQERIAGLMEASGTAAKTTGTEAETAFEKVGTGIQGLADTSAIAERGYGTTAGTLGKATELAQRGYGTTAGTLGTAAAAAQRGYGTAADTATDTSLGLQREKAAKDYATQSAKSQRALGSTLGTPDLQKGADLSQYMSQYTAGVTDPQLQQLMEFQRMQGEELGSQAAQSGAYGGARADVEQRKLREQTGQQAAEIIGKSQQEAFQSAQQAFQADRAAQQQAQTAELAAERGALAAETGQQATQLSAEQQALQQQMRQEQFGAGQEQAAHQTAMDAQRFGAGQEQAAHQARMDAERFGLGVEQGAHQTAVGGMQANLAAQQAALAAAQQGRSQYEGALTGAAGLADVGTGRQLQGYGTAADMMGGQQRSMAAGLGAYGQLAGIGGQQMGLGGQQQAEQMGRFDMMNRYGGQQRQLQQAALDIQKAEHQQAMQYPERQIGWMSQQLGALPYQNIVSESTYAPQAGPLSTMAGAAISGAGLVEDWRANQPHAAQPVGTGPLNPDGSPINITLPGSNLPPIDTGITDTMGTPPPSSPTPFNPVPPTDTSITPTLGEPPPPVGPPLAGGGYLPYAQGGGYLPYAQGIIGVGRGMGR